ncbi:MAG: hypothetical protein Q7S27_01505 [Nanoarchaeota archaeon]|nr:hypothetical protein [Nanoarchaeota archaeon]
MIDLEVDGECWRYAFAQPDGVLSSEDREYLLRETVRLYKKGDEKLRIKGKEFEGRLIRGKFECFGACSGREYNAELETQKGKRYASILVAKTIDSSLN